MRIVVEVDESGRVDVTGERYSGSHLPVHAVVAEIAAAVDTALRRYVASQTAAGGDALTGDSAGAPPPAAPTAELPAPEPPSPGPVPAPEPTTGQLRTRLAELLEVNPEIDVPRVAATLGCSHARARRLLLEAGAL